MFKKSLLAVALLTSLTTGALAETDKTSKEDVSESRPSRSEFAKEVKQSLNQFGSVQGIQELPISKLFFVQADGGSYMISADGRFAIKGTIQDVWHRRTLRTIADVQAAERVPLANMKFNFEKDLASLQVGSTDIPRQGVIFADPTSQLTKDFLAQVLENEEKYNFTVIMMPLVGGDEAASRAISILCAPDREAAIRDMANGTDDSFMETNEGCGDQKLTFTVFMQEVFRIENLPHLVREDGLVSSGLPEDLDAWLEAK
jgi:thiol:disulfide interchange protein DsbC